MPIFLPSISIFLYSISFFVSSDKTTDLTLTRYVKSLICLDKDEISSLSKFVIYAVERISVGLYDFSLRNCCRCRDQTLIIQGLVRDLSRNLQQLRIEISYNLSEIFSTAYITNLDT